MRNDSLVVAREFDDLCEWVSHPQDFADTFGFAVRPLYLQTFQSWFTFFVGLILLIGTYHERRGYRQDGYLTGFYEEGAFKQKWLCNNWKLVKVIQCVSDVPSNQFVEHGGGCCTQRQRNLKLACLGIECQNLVVTNVETGSPAEEANVLNGFEIRAVSIAGSMSKMESDEQLLAYVDERCESVEITFGLGAASRVSNIPMSDNQTALMNDAWEVAEHESKQISWKAAFLADLKFTNMATAFLVGGLLSTINAYLQLFRLASAHTDSWGSFWEILALMLSQHTAIGTALQALVQCHTLRLFLRGLKCRRRAVFLERASLAVCLPVFCLLLSQGWYALMVYMIPSIPPGSLVTFILWKLFYANESLGLGYNSYPRAAKTSFVAFVRLLPRYCEDFPAAFVVFVAEPLLIGTAIWVVIINPFSALSWEFFAAVILEMVTPITVFILFLLTQGVLVAENSVYDRRVGPASCWNFCLCVVLLFYATTVVPLSMCAQSVGISDAPGVVFANRKISVWAKVLFTHIAQIPGFTQIFSILT